ncbi:hypothetical protein [Cohnella faecalis]|uniref:Uncharacterized protein n=1 Tax=Cohnella faecalis TaxID=2315694 RepID=A0A398CRR3_9BACL|nr:hypothetical protein [Cohnella faecalis]RIE05252.1 hypothetical protein D3H35_01650 [Cohnella faecalis]
MRVESGTIGNPGLEEKIRALTEEGGMPYEQAVMLAALARLNICSEEGKTLLQGLSKGRLRLPDEPASRWLAEIASWLYGPAGPKVQVTKRRKSMHADNV